MSASFPPYPPGASPGAGQGNWWQRAAYGGPGDALAPGGAAVAPGGYGDWLRQRQQWQQGLGYPPAQGTSGQQGGLAAPGVYPPGVGGLGQQQGGLYGTGNSGGYLSGTPTTSGGTGVATGAAPSWLPAFNAGADATMGGRDALQTGQAPAGQPNDPLRGLNTAGGGAGVALGGGQGMWYDALQGNPAATDALRQPPQAPPPPPPTTPPPATTPPPPVAMQNGRPPTSQVTTAAQLATTPSSSAPAATAAPAATTTTPATTAPVTTAAPPAASSTAPVTIGGGSGATGAGPVRQINEALVKAYYTNRNPGAFWQQAGQILAGGDRQFENYFVQNFDRYMAQYLQAAEKDQNLQLSDWLTGAEGAQIRNDYLMQAPEQRGLDYRRTDPGRFDMRY